MFPQRFDSEEQKSVFLVSGYICNDNFFFFFEFLTFRVLPQHPENKTTSVFWNVLKLDSVF